MTTDGPREWTEQEVRVVEELTAFLAQAVVHQRLQEVQDLQLRELRALDQYKDEFLATVSHELRTPLTSIGGYLEILRDGDLGPVAPAQDRALEVVTRNADRLRGLIEDLLVLNRMSAAGPRGERGPVDLGAVTTAAVEVLGPTAATAEVHLVAEVLGDDLVVEGDAAQLERAVLNVLGNAVKFTPPGGRVTARVWADGRFVRVEVEDTGIGIPAEDIARLAERFFRAANATAPRDPRHRPRPEHRARHRRGPRRRRRHRLGGGLRDDGGARPAGGPRRRRRRGGRRCRVVRAVTPGRRDLGSGRVARSGRATRSRRVARGGATPAECRGGPVRLGHRVPPLAHLSAGPVHGSDAFPERPPHEGRRRGAKGLQHGAGPADPDPSKERIVKKDIHPEYVETTVTCTCGNTFTTRSTATDGVIHADVCSNCHPFYTGKQKILDTGGRVARFEARYGKKAAK